MGYDIIALNSSTITASPQGIIDIICPSPNLACINNCGCGASDTFCPTPTTGCSNCMCDFDIGCDPFGPDSVGTLRPR